MERWAREAHSSRNKHVIWQRQRLQAIRLRGTSPASLDTIIRNLLCALGWGISGRSTRASERRKGDGRAGPLLQWAAESQGWRQEFAWALELRGSDPWIRSMDQIHGSGPWIRSMDQIPGSDPWIGSMDPKGSQRSPKRIPRRPKQTPRGPKRPQRILQQK